MGIDIRMPNITGATEREQLAQIRSYLYQFVPQLQWALNALETLPSSGVVTQQVVGKGAAAPAASAEPTFNSIKALIIKSADIVDAYYEEINRRMYSEYKALSDFGTYSNQTEKLVRETAAFTDEIYNTLATISGDIEYVRKSEGYIRTGKLVESLSAKEAAIYGKKEGEALVGVEVGEKTDGVFKQFARFTPSRLSFYNQDSYEVAFISNYQLSIRNVTILSSYQIGGYMDTVMVGGGVITKWVGGEA